MCKLQNVYIQIYPAGVPCPFLRNLKMIIIKVNYI